MLYLIPSRKWANFFDLPEKSLGLAIELMFGYNVVVGESYECRSAVYFHL